MLIHLSIITLSFYPALISFWIFLSNFANPITIIFYLLFPLELLFCYLIIVFSSIFIAKIFLLVVNLIHKPKEGVFKRSKDDKDYIYWCLRGLIKKWPVWITHNFPMPYLDNLLFKVFGVKTNSGNYMFEGWIDCEFIEFGKNVIVGVGSVVMGAIIIDNYLIIQKTIIEDDSIIGAHSLVAPGTKFGKGTILNAVSSTHINQVLESGCVYKGTPAIKIGDYNVNEKIDNLKVILFEKSDSKEIYQNVHVETSIYDKSNIRQQTNNLKKEDKPHVRVQFHIYIPVIILNVGGSFLIPAIPFFIFLYEVLIPYLFSTPFGCINFTNLFSQFLLLITPLVLMGLYLLHLFFVALFTKLLYKWSEKLSPSRQGVLDRNFESRELNFYHHRSFLLKYPTLAFSKSPFPWLTNLALNFIGANKIGKRTTFEDQFITKEFLNTGENCYFGQFCYLTNHLVDGFFGEENITFFGVKIGNNSVLSVYCGGFPGTEIGEYSTLLPMSATVKLDKLGDNGYYAGFPLKRITKEELKKYLGGIDIGD